MDARKPLSLSRKRKSERRSAIEETRKHPKEAMHLVSVDEQSKFQRLEMSSGSSSSSKLCKMDSCVTSECQNITGFHEVPETMSPIFSLHHKSRYSNVDVLIPCTNTVKMKYNSHKVKTVFKTKSSKSTNKDLSSQPHNPSQKTLDSFLVSSRKVALDDENCSSLTTFDSQPIPTTHEFQSNVYLRPYSTFSLVGKSSSLHCSGSKTPKSSAKSILPGTSSSVLTGNSTSVTMSQQILNRKYCPHYKWIAGTGFTVDAFNYGSIPDCTSYFLSHFHSDHYMGLNKHFRHPIYCSKITANLVCQQLKVSSHIVHSLPLHQACVLNQTEVVLIDANHCPGSVMFLFKLTNGNVILHTGDFRATKSMQQCQFLMESHINTVYLDTTYINSRYDFPSQEAVIDFVKDCTLKYLTENPRTLIVCGAYTIGKEKIFLSIAETLNCKVFVNGDKKRIIDCLESEEILQIIESNDPVLSPLHVLPMNKLNTEVLRHYLSKFSSQYTSLLAFKPTGWTYANKSNLTSIKPQVYGPISIYGVPYSEHCSYSELKKFVQFLHPVKVVSTVGGYKARGNAETRCYQWIKECCNSSVVKKPVQITLDSFFGNK